MARSRRPSCAQAALLIEAGALLTLAAAAVRFLPFETIGRLASRHRRRVGLAPASAAIAGVRWAVMAMARRTPLRAKCFETGLAAQWMLQRRGHRPTLHYGARLEPAGGLSAHVWVRLDGLDVVGCDNAAEFAELTHFPTGAARAARLDR